MATYIMLTRVSPESSNGPTRLRELESSVKSKVAEHCPEVRWQSNYAILGPYDYLDVFEAPDDRAASRVATIVRSFGHATTETWPALPWQEYKESLDALDR